MLSQELRLVLRLLYPPPCIYKGGKQGQVFDFCNWGVFLQDHFCFNEI